MKSSHRRWVKTTPKSLLGKRDIFKTLRGVSQNSSRIAIFLCFGVWCVIRPRSLNLSGKVSATPFERRLHLRYSCPLRAGGGVVRSRRETPKTSKKRCDRVCATPYSARGGGQHGFATARICHLTLNGIQTAQFKGTDRHTCIHGYTCGGGGQTGSICHCACPSFCRIWGSQDTQMLGKTARKVSLSPFVCAPKAGKNQDFKAVCPDASRQSTGKMSNRPHFALIQGSLHGNATRVAVGWCPTEACAQSTPWTQGCLPCGACR